MGFDAGGWYFVLGGECDGWEVSWEVLRTGCVSCGAV